MNRYAPADEGNKSTPALSYINTDQESSPLFAVQTVSGGKERQIVHQMQSQSSLAASGLIETSSDNMLSIGQIKGPSRNAPSCLIQDNSDSTLNARAPPLHLRSSQGATTADNHHRSSTLLSNPATSSSNNLNQRQQ